jgi:hypothetical protein
MSRGFDGFDIDDFRGWESERYRPGRESSQGRGSGSQSGGTVRSKLENRLQAAGRSPQIYVFRFQVLCICRGRFLLFPFGGNVLREYPAVIAPGRGTTRRRRR